MDQPAPPHRPADPQTERQSPPVQATARPRIPPAPPMQIITRGWWPRADEEATVDELEIADRSLAGVDVDWTYDDPHQVRLSGRDRYWPVVCQIETSELQKDGLPPLSVQDCKSLVGRNLAAFRRIFAAKYKRGAFSEPTGPSGRPYRLVQLTRDDITASGEEIHYETPVAGHFRSR
jgi:hypothetical protein